ncbi:hypothetical protein NL676_012413 [Syzygium grande]|nr:hypothetical protein NL676_012413 [Syzygium grande]
MTRTLLSVRERSLEARPETQAVQYNVNTVASTVARGWPGRVGGSRGHEEKGGEGGGSDDEGREGVGVAERGVDGGGDGGAKVADEGLVGEEGVEWRIGGGGHGWGWPSGNVSMWGYR